jgi:hypothetical protein
MILQNRQSTLSPTELLSQFKNSSSDKQCPGA